jgi:hypothetical protein
VVFAILSLTNRRPARKPLAERAAWEFIAEEGNWAPRSNEEAIVAAARGYNHAQHGDKVR